jgi:hypothetical protein
MSTPRGTRMLEEQRRREREAKAKAEAAKRAKADVLLAIPAQKEGGLMDRVGRALSDIASDGNRSFYGRPMNSVTSSKSRAADSSKPNSQSKPVAKSTAPKTRTVTPTAPKTRTVTPTAPKTQTVRLTQDEKKYIRLNEKPKYVKLNAHKEGGRADKDFTGLMKKAASRAAAKGNPVMKQGGATRDYIEKRVNARMEAGNYKDGGRAEVRRDRKMLDIEKDYKIALAKGKNEGVAKAKYEQRKADAADDYAKATKADRTATKAAEKSAEATLKEARRTKGISIDNRDAGEAFMQKNSKSIEPKMDVASTLKGVGGLGAMPSAAAPKAAAPARKAPVVRQARPAAVAAPAPARPAAARPAAPAASAAGSRSNPFPANKKEDVVVTAGNKRDNTAAGRRERLGDVISSVNPFRAIARGIDSALTAGTGPSKPVPRAPAAKPDAAKAGRLAGLKKAAEAPGASGFAISRYRDAVASGMYKNGGEATPVKRAAGGAGKVRKGQMKGC